MKELRASHYFSFYLTVSLDSLNEIFFFEAVSLKHCRYGNTCKISTQIICKEWKIFCKNYCKSISGAALIVFTWLEQTWLSSNYFFFLSTVEYSFLFFNIMSNSSSIVAMYQRNSRQSVATLYNNPIQWPQDINQSVKKRWTEYTSIQLG